MKKAIFILAVVAAGLASCGQSQIEKDARAVCDCLHKTKGPEPVKTKAKCLDLQRTSGEKYMNNPEDLKKYNDIVTPCIIETLGE